MINRSDLARLVRDAFAAAHFVGIETLREREAFALMFICKAAGIDPVEQLRLAHVPPPRRPLPVVMPAIKPGEKL